MSELLEHALAEKERQKVSRRAFLKGLALGVATPAVGFLGGILATKATSREESTPSAATTTQQPCEPDKSPPVLPQGAPATPKPQMY